MNERIRTLAGQSGFDVTHHKWIFANDNVGEGECHELLAKFTELIVRECAMFSMVITDDHYDVDALYKHFGVEE